jgi:hypothetical protein
LPAGNVLILALGANLSVLPIRAQTNVGSISGSVSDSSGAFVPDCLVTATSLGTGLKQDVHTQESGFYTFPVLPAGTYSMVAEKAGFRSSTVSGVVLDATEHRSLNFTLQIGDIKESVTVSAEVGQVLSDRQLSQIALNGRNYSQMLQLLPGATVITLDPLTLNLSTTSENVNGVVADSLLVSIDGAANMDNVGNINAAVEPNADAIAEVKIQSSTYNAEFGGRAGALMNVITKSGNLTF